MKSLINVDSTRAVSIFRNTIRVLPYLWAMGLIWGYLAGGSEGAVAGLLAASAASVCIGKAETDFSHIPDGGAVNTRSGQGSSDSVGGI